MATTAARMLAAQHAAQVRVAAVEGAQALLAVDPSTTAHALPAFWQGASADTLAKEISPAVRDSLMDGIPVVGGLADAPSLAAGMRHREPAIALHFFPVGAQEELAGCLVVAGASSLDTALSWRLAVIGRQAGHALRRFAHYGQRMRQYAERFHVLVENSADVITVLDADGTIRYQSPSVRSVLGYRENELVGTSVFAIHHPEDAAGAMARYAESAGPNGEAVAARWLHADGYYLHVETVTRDLLDDPEFAGFVLTTRDVTERRSLEAQLRHQALHDPMTGLANRALFADRVERALARADHDQTSVAALVIDVNDFKAINDGLGHAAGDAVLSGIARRLRHAVREMDIVARLGGDEFAVLLEDADEKRAIAITGRLQRAMLHPFQVEGTEVSARLSIGIAVRSAEQRSFDDLLRGADCAMYRAKSRGTGIEIFDPDMHGELTRRLELTSSLQRAIERDELLLHYQPILDLCRGVLTGAEALVRWQHPVHGLIAPDEFIPLAEETGLIVPIGRWVLREACRQAHTWQQQYNLPSFTIAVNVSPRQLNHGGLPDEVATALSQSGLQASSLILELTENTLIDDIEETANQMRALKRLGVNIAIDDLGAGRSALAQLRHLPIDIIKLDRSLVDGLANADRGSALASAIIRLGESINARTVAEGIEDKAQLNRLRGLGCDLGQGFYFGRPTNPADLAKLLARESAPSE